MRFSRQEYWSGLPFPPPASSWHTTQWFNTSVYYKDITTVSSRGTFPPRDQTQVSCGSCIGRQVLYPWATREAPAESSARVYIQGFPLKHTPQSNSLLILTIEIIFKWFASYIHFILPLLRTIVFCVFQCICLKWTVWSWWNMWGKATFLPLIISSIRWFLFWGWKLLCSVLPT